MNVTLILSGCAQAFWRLHSAILQIMTAFSHRADHGCIQPSCRSWPHSVVLQIMAAFSHPADHGCIQPPGRWLHSAVGQAGRYSAFKKSTTALAVLQTGRLNAVFSLLLFNGTCMIFKLPCCGLVICEWFSNIQFRISLRVANVASSQLEWRLPFSLLLRLG